WLFSNFLSGFSAAALLQRSCTSPSSISPSSSTARQRYIRRPLIFTTISSRCQRPVGGDRRQRKFRRLRPELHHPSSKHRLVQAKLAGHSSGRQAARGHVINRLALEGLGKHPKS